MSFEVGQKVRTTREDASAVANYQIGARSDNKWGVQGTIEEISDGHGRCYKVGHDDGGFGWYEPTELEKGQFTVEEVEVLILQERVMSYGSAIVLIENLTKKKALDGLYKAIEKAEDKLKARGAEVPSI